MRQRRRDRHAKVLSVLRHTALSLCTFLVWSAASPALGFDLEAGSLNNRLYVVINHPDNTAALTNLIIHFDPPAFISTLRPVHLPNSVPAGGAAMAGFEFDSDPSAQLAVSGTLLVTVAGTVNPLVYTLQGPAPSTHPEVSYDVSLQIVSSAPTNQGMVVGTVPGVADIDSDGDGTSDLDEIANGTDPFDPDSGGFSPSGSNLKDGTEPEGDPGDPDELVRVPGLGPTARLLLLALFAFAGGRWATRRPKA